MNKAMPYAVNIVALSSVIALFIFFTHSSQMHGVSPSGVDTNVQSGCIASCSSHSQITVDNNRITNKKDEKEKDPLPYFSTSSQPNVLVLLYVASITGVIAAVCCQRKYIHLTTQLRF